MDNILSEKTDYKTWTDSYGVTHKIKDSLDEIPLEEFIKPDSSYMSIQDENLRMYTDPNADQRHMRHYTDDSDGSVVLRAPSKLSWPTLASIIAVVVNLLIAGSAFYFNQSGFNDNVKEKLLNLETQHIQLKEGVYSKREEDLRYENLKLELAKQDEAIKYLQSR